MNPIVGQCPICHIGIHGLEEHVVDEGNDYHSHCWIKMIGKKLAHLEHKQQRQDITLSEAKEMEEYKKMLLDNVINKGRVDHPQKKLITSPSDNLITRPKERLLSMKSVREETFKRLEEARSARWAWETFNVIEHQILISGSSEYPQLTDGRNNTP